MSLHFFSTVYDRAVHSVQNPPMPLTTWLCTDREIPSFDLIESAIEIRSGDIDFLLLMYDRHPGKSKRLPKIPETISIIA